jgi:phage gpG-like protein
MSDEINPHLRIHAGQLKAVIRLKKELENPEKLMKKLGAMVLGASVNSFKVQHLGEFQWAPRYPQQEAPKLNLAGFVADFHNGRATPKPIRFVDRPALIDEGFRGGLVASMTYKALDATSFQVGTVKPYAATHQYGGRTSQTITQQMKAAMRKWLYKGGKKEKGYKKNAAPYADKVEGLLRMDQLDTSVGKRPFVGIFSELWSDILKAIDEHFKPLAEGK